MDEHGVVIKNKARLEAIQIFLAYVAYMGFVIYQIDVKSAFLKGKSLRKSMYNHHLGLKVVNFPTIKSFSELAGLISNSPYVSMLGFNLKAYCDSRYDGCNLDRKSTSEGCQILGGKLVCWSAKKQSSVAMSSAKAEYVPIFYDNTSAIAISNYLVLHSRTKHIDIRYHFIRDYILKGDTALHFVPTDMQLVDIFTKPLAEPSFTRLVAKLGMLNIEKVIPDKIKDYKNDKLKTFKPHHISATSFKIPFENEVAMIPHMMQVAKNLPVLEKTLILPSKEVNTGNSADKSLFGTSMQPISQSKASTDKKSRKKINPSSSQPKTSKIVRESSLMKKVAETQHAEEPMAIANATKDSPFSTNHLMHVHEKIVKEAVKDYGITLLGSITFEELFRHDTNIGADEIPFDTESEIKFIGNEKVV
ncbi:hypothetical protein Tco_1563211 [Tanacetum coccineum]